MRVMIAMGSEVLSPKTTVVTALLHSPDSRIGLRPNLSMTNYNRKAVTKTRALTPVAGQTPYQTARELREEEAGGYEAGIVTHLSAALPRDSCCEREVEVERFGGEGGGLAFSSVSATWKSRTMKGTKGKRTDTVTASAIIRTNSTNSCETR